jgi:hypothetical protein
MLSEVAQEKGIAGFTAEVLASNRKMMNVLYKSGYNVRSKLDNSVFFVSFRFDEKMSNPPA